MEELSKPAQFMASKMKELEKGLSLNLERHVSMKNANSPYYVVRMAQNLDKILTHIDANNDGRQFVESTGVNRQFEHLSAELQALFTEYGFSKTYDAIYEVGEGAKKLDVLLQKLSAIEKKANDTDESVVIGTINDVIASEHGIRQAMTDANLQKLESKFDALIAKIAQLESKFCAANIKVGSQVLTEYLAHQHLLRKAFVESIVQSDTFDVINSHMIHPGTRGWVLEAYERWQHSDKKRVFYLAGKQGAGKTAIAATVCKLYNYDVIANHFCSAEQGDVFMNEMNGVVQSIAAGLCRTMPEYLNWLDDKYGSQTQIPNLGNWQNSYNALLKEPLQALYGVGKNVDLTLAPKIIIIDGLDEMRQSDWSEFKQFQTQFVADLPPAFRLFFTLRLKFFNNLVVLDQDKVEGIRLEDRSTCNRHIKDIEIYLSSCLGKIQSRSVVMVRRYGCFNFNLVINILSHFHKYRSYSNIGQEILSCP